MDNNKVRAPSKVAAPLGPMGSYPQASAPNPSQRGMNAPAVPPGASGTDGNGIAAPSDHRTISADMSTKVRPTIPRTDHPRIPRYDRPF